MRALTLTALTFLVLASASTLGGLVRPDAAFAADPGPWLERSVTACDRKKTVIVEGADPERPMAPAKARQVAALLMDLMRFCNEEVKARMTRHEEIFLSVNGLPYERYVMGSEIPHLVHGKDHSKREQMIWEAEYKKMVKEGDRLFHSPELGKNGIACDMCHPNASNNHPETYPKFQTQLKKMALLRDMVNWCIENPLEGPKLAEDDPKMKAIEAYILHERKGVPMAPGKH